MIKFYPKFIASLILVICFFTNNNLFSADSTTPLYQACLNRDFSRVKFLIASGADVNQFNRDTSGFAQYRFETPIMAAIRNKDRDLIKYLVEHGVKLNFVPAVVEAADFTPLSLAIRLCQNNKAEDYADRIQIVSFLIENGADINFITQNGSLLTRSIGSIWMKDYE